MKKYCPNHPDKRLWAEGVCRDCYMKQYAKPLRKIIMTSKEKNTLSVYRLLIRRKLRDKPKCEIGVFGCTMYSTEVHLTSPKLTRNLSSDVSKMVACCKSCYSRAENSPNIAKQLGIYNYKIETHEDILVLFDDTYGGCC